MATVAYAAPITYAFNGTASGRLGSTTFSNAAFVITAVGETNDITSLGAGVPCNDFRARPSPSAVSGPGISPARSVSP